MKLLLMFYPKNYLQQRLYELYFQEFLFFFRPHKRRQVEVAMAWGAIPWLYPTEIFPMDVKEKAISLTVLCQFGANFIVAQISPYQIDILGIPATMLFYAVTLGLNFVFVYFCIPETKGVAMEDMDQLFGARTYEY